MLREIPLRPIATVSGWGSYVSPATSPYPWLGTGSTTPHEAWATNGEAALGAPSATKFAYCWPEGGTEHIVSFEPGPTLALFTKVTVKTRFDTSQSGPNNWWYPPDNAGGPGVQFILRNRAKDNWITAGGKRLGVDYSPNAPGDLTTVNNFNTQPSDGDVWSLTPWFEQEWTSHPEGGPWTLEDINNLAAGVSFLYSLGPNGKAYDETQGSFFYIRVPQFVVTLTVQDLGGYVRSVRHNSSATLRMKRKARNTISISIPAERAVKEIGEVAFIAHERGPGSGGEGWGTEPLERRIGYIAERSYFPEELRTRDNLYDLYDYSCEAWAAFRIPIAWTPELSGLAYLDQGGEWTMTRAQDAWSLRPGDGAAVRVLEDYLNLSEEGLAIHSANGVESALSNAELGGAGWTSATTGGASFAAETKQPMADELGYTDAVKLTISGTPGTASKSRTFALAGGDTVSVRVRARNISVDDPVTKFLECTLQAPDSKYWDEANRTWSVAAVHNPISGAGGFGEVIFDQVPDNGAGTYTLAVGRLSSAINSCEFVVALVSAQVNAHGCGMPLVTLAAPLTREPDVFVMDNADPYTFWHRDRGMVIVEWRPFWRADALAPATEKPIIRADHAVAAFDEVRFVAGATDSLVFERSDTGGSRTVAVDILDLANDPLKLTRDNYVRVFVRWLDDQGWRQHAPYEAMIGYAVYDAAGTFLTYHEERAAWAAPAVEAEDTVTIAGLDGWVRWLEVKRNPMSGSEAVWRR